MLILSVSWHLRAYGCDKGHFAEFALIRNIKVNGIDQPISAEVQIESDVQ